MRGAGVPAAALLLAASLLIQVFAEDIYWEGEEDASNEFLEVKEDEGFAGRLMRIKRDLSFDPLRYFFAGSPATTTTQAPDSYDSATAVRADELITDEKDDDGDADGSGLPSFGDAEQREKTLRVSFVVMHPYQQEYSNRDSQEFQNFSKSLANAVTKLYQGNSEIHGSQRASLVRIQSRATDDFSCKVTLDIVSTGYDNMEKIKQILQEHIRYSRALDNLAVNDNDFNAKVIDPANGICASDEIRCGDGDCLPASARCNGVPECSDGVDEAGCSPGEVEWQAKTQTLGGRQRGALLHHASLGRNTWQAGHARKVESEAPFTVKSDCQTDELKCDDTRCVLLSKRCDGVSDCHDNADELNCINKSCGADDFRCNDNKCVPKSVRCNGVVDCSSSEDEQGCDCKPGYFRCVQDGLCIEGRKHCDGVSHCRDGSDEENCPNACASDQWQCDHGNCIKRSQRCDGRVDCPTDRSDERNCIVDGYFRCRSGKLIPNHQRCNRAYDCSTEDLSDEQNCQCGDGDFRCENGYCIPAFKHCDGTHDCQDKSDELHCTYGTKCMASYEYECSSGQCVRTEALCNGTAECADGSDERNCPCARDSFTCRGGLCLNIASRCNGQRDCPHGEDESNCGGQQCDAAGQMACAPGTMVPCAIRCDGFPECAGGEDEAGCAEVVTVAPGCELECDGQCLPSDRICDGRQDCRDGSDEYQCRHCPGPDDFRCLSGECISNKHRCNSLPDCPDESDEKGCNQTMTPTPECRETEFLCPISGGCLDSQFRCDGRNDCGDNSDEENCQNYAARPSSSPAPRTPCHESQFTCYNGRCIPHARRCDNVYDCLDFSDEQNCYNSGCDENQLQCRSGQCLQLSQHCDGFEDCPDGSDERDCPPTTSARSHISCDAGEWQCGSGECIFLEQQCDGRSDCPDRSDEYGCNVPPTTSRPNGPSFRTCDESQWQCVSGECIYRQQRCDGYRHCQDNSDEYNCAAPAPEVPTERYPPARPEPQQPIYTTTARAFYPPPRPNPDFRGCDAGEWQCGSGECIFLEQQCDGRSDCPDRSDEYGCNVPPTTSRPNGPSFRTCDETQWQCGSGECIYRQQRCDGYRHCQDNSDEYNCATPAPEVPTERYPPARPEPQQPIYTTTARAFYPPPRPNPDFRGCDAGEWQCGSGECIFLEQQCDGRSDCPDRSDEYGCNVPPTTSRPNGPSFRTCDETQWQCGSGECIYRQQRCDGYRHCQDNSDEYNCAAPAPEVPTERYPPARPEPQEPIYTTTARAFYPPPRPNPDFRGGCARNQWRCENGPCIDLARVCDGRVDCPRDRSDELDCPSSKTSALQLMTYPNAQIVRHGGDVVFQCRDNGTLRVPVRWVRENGRPLKPGSTDVHGRLEMSKVTASDSGVYICQAPSYLGQPGAELRVTLTVQTTPPESSVNAVLTCQSHEATCGNGQCILRTAVCDGKSDCADHSDEDNCHHNGLCEPNQIRCANRRCVLKSWVCDAQDDCGDGSDEQDCGQAAPGQPCLQTEFTCSDAQCIPKSFHCDGQSDCIDKSDEMGCAPVHVTKTPQPAHARLNPGETLTLECEAVGVPTPLITWRLNWGHVPSKCTPKSYNGIGSLTCHNMQPEDSGAYSCEAINNKGTVFAAPDSIVHVNRTDVCPSGTFNSEARSPSECISCFCFGESRQCKSADLFIYNMPTPLGQGGTRLVGVKQTYNGEVRLDSQPITEQYYYQSLRNGATVTKLENYGGYPAAPGPRSYPYLTLPEFYNGNQLTSYGGHIKYKLSPQSPRFSSGYDNMPDIIIKGKFETLVYNRRSGGMRETHIEARLTEANWQKSRSDGLAPATREDIMMALDSVELILLRASVNDVGVNITDFVMESAQGLNVGLGSANLVEECTCPPGYEGLSCQKCSSGYVRENSGAWLGNCVREEPRSCPPGTYGAPAAGMGCQPCPCPLTNRDNQFARTCSLGPRGNVICDCAQGYEGDVCERCAPGYVGNPLTPGDSCQPRRASNCDPIGTYRINLPDECECKENVHGQYCNQCNNGSFHLSEDNRHGCALCFCTRNSQECTSSNLRRKTTSVVYNIPEIVEQVSVYESAPFAGAGALRYDAPVPAAISPRFLHGEVALVPVDRSQDNIYYWSLPPSFAGDLVTAYGGYLRYVLHNVPTSGIKNNAADIQLISDKNLRYQYFGGYDLSSDGTLTGTVQLLEKGWQRADGEEIPRQFFLMALADVKAILVKATRTSDFQIATLVSSSIDTATADGTGPVAVEVEQCECPLGYVGTSCESCAPGYTRSSSGLYFKHCELCDCNGHSDTCHPETGVCSNCRDNTAGNSCEECRPGYERDAYRNCVRTRQDPPDDNCNCDPRGQSEPCDASGYCPCKRNVEGESCERCRPGTFGLDQDNPEGCTPCYCSGVTRDCSEATTYVRYPIPVPIIGETNGDYTITDLNALHVFDNDMVSNVNESELMYIFKFEPSEELFWSLPHLKGNMLLSYGGNLVLTQGFRSNDLYPTSTRGVDVVLVGDENTVYWTNPQIITSESPLRYHVPILERGWYILNSAIPASRNIFMSVLRNLRRVLVRATLTPKILSASIAAVQMDTATEGTGLPAAKGIEICRCPPGYTGKSCESCASGYYSHRQRCQLCNCNGHDCHMGSNNEVICDCRGEYSGRDCSIADNQVTVTTRRPLPPQSSVTVIISNPSIKIENVGGTVNFTCEARSRMTQRPLPVTWTKVDGHLAQGRYLTDRRTGSLIITRVQESDSGTYICQTQDGVSTGHAYATLTVGSNSITQPTVSIKPSVNDYYEGDRVELQCESTGNPTPEITWQRANGQPLPITMQSTESYLIIENVKLEDSGEYRCIAKNSAGRTARIAVINVRPRPSRPSPDKLMIKPSSPNVVEGQSTNIICTGTASVPAGSIGWVRQDGAELSSNVRSANGILYVDVARLENQGVYVCQTTTQQAASVPILLSVISLNTPPPSERSNIQVNKERLKIATGDSATIDCNPSGDPLPDITWRKYQDDLGPRTSQRGNTLFISNAQDDDEGYYVCIGKVDGIEIGNINVMVEIETRIRPQVEIYPEGEQVAPLGGRVELTCRVLAGIPPPVITWSRGRGRLQEMSRFTEILPHNTLTFQQIEVNDEGEYICTASNSAGSASANATLKVRSRPVITITPRSYYDLAQGESVDVQCRANGYPEPMVSIKNEYRMLVAPSLSIATLHIQDVHDSDAGDYTCVASSAAGTEQEQFAIRVGRGDVVDQYGEGSGENEFEDPYERDPDRIPSDMVITAAEGEESRIGCEASSEFEVRWSRVDRRPLQRNAIQIGNKLIIRNTSKSDSGQYECVKLNRRTRIEQQATFTTLRVLAPPRITLRPPTQTVRPGQSPTVECVVEGDGDLDVSWQPVQKPFSSRVQSRGTTLIFRQIEVEDAGKYVCFARNRAANASATAQVIVSEETDRAPSHANEQVAYVGASVRFGCNVSQPHLAVSWTKDGRALPGSVRQLPGGWLHIKLVKKSDSGRYVCLIRDRYGRTTNNYINLHIEGIECLETQFSCTDGNGCIDKKLRCDGSNDCENYSDEDNCPNTEKRRSDYPTHTGPREEDQALVAIEQPRRPYTVDEDVRVLCRISSSDVRAWWEKIGTPEHVEQRMYRDGSMLIITRAAESDSGVYRCIGEKPYGGRSYDDFSLEVLPGSRGPSYPASNQDVTHTARLGEAVDIACPHDLEEPVSYEWRLEFTSLPSYVRPYERNLYLNPVTEADAGTYICSARNERTSTEARVVLLVTGVVRQFGGASWLSMRTLEDAYLRLDIEISFKPTDNNGLILYNGENEGPYGNFIALQLVNGYPQMIIGTSSSPAVARGDRPLSLDTWHTIRLSRMYTKVSMSVDDTGPFTTELPRHHTMDLKQPLYIGGVPDLSQLPNALSGTSGFVGCVGMLILGKQENDITRNSIDSYDVSECNTCAPNLCLNRGICQEARNERGYVCLCPRGFAGRNCDHAGEGCRPGICGPGKCTETPDSYKCSCPITYTGPNCNIRQSIEYPAFTGSAYLAIKTPETTRSLHMSMKVRAMNPVTDGIIVYCAESELGYGGFTSLAVREGRLEFRYQVGDGSNPVILTSRYPFAANEWTEVNISRTGAYVILRINPSNEVVRGRLDHPQEQQRLTTALYVGGVDDSNIVLNNNTGVSGGFSGCIKDVIVQEGPIDIVNASIVSANVQECTQHDRGDIPEDANVCSLCGANGYCKSADASACTCLAGFTGVYCEDRVPLSARRVPATGEPCAKHPCMHNATCRPGRRDPTSNLNYSCDCPLGFSGVNCQIPLQLTEDGVSFSGNGYLELAAELLDYSNDDPALIALAVNISSDDAILLYQREQRAGSYGDYILLRVEHGHVVFEWNKGAGNMSVAIEDIEVSNRERHQIVVRMFRNNQVELQVDHRTKTETYQGFSNVMNADSNIYLGGVPEWLNERRIPGLTGCVQGVEFTNMERTLDLRQAVAGRNAQRCRDQWR